MAPKQPAIVAELGRPETPEETANRKAENSRKHRASQTLVNLVVATVASLAIVLFHVVVVVRPDPGPPTPVDFSTTAAEAQAQATAPLVVPVLPPGWYANSARFDAANDLPVWYVGFVTPSTQFIALNQGIGADRDWQDTLLDSASATGSVTIDAVTWTVFDRRDQRDTGNFAYSMATTTGTSTIVLHGTAPVGEFELLAASIASALSTQ